MKRLIVIILIINLFCIISAQSVFDRPTPTLNPNFNLGGLLHPDKMKMNHSMSFISGMSSSGYGYYQSNYTNHLQFQLQKNLKLNVDISVINHGTMSHNNDLNFKGNNDNQNFVVPSFSLEFKPTENTTLHIEYRQFRGHQLNPYSMHDSWNRHY